MHPGDCISVSQLKGEDSTQAGKAWHMAGETSRLTAREGQLRWAKEGPGEEVARSSSPRGKRLPGV